MGNNDKPKFTFKDYVVKFLIVLGILIFISMPPAVVLALGWLVQKFGALNTFCWVSVALGLVAYYILYRILDAELDKKDKKTDETNR